jgi:hypothetical protein
MTIYNPGMVKFDPQKHHRNSIRLKGYDYSQAGTYFVTLVTWRREFLFGETVNGEMKLNQRGKIAEACWQLIPEHFQNVGLGAYVIMPNHVHGIIIVNGMGVARYASPLRPHGTSSGSLGAIVGSFKSAVTKRIGHELNETGIWHAATMNTLSALTRICKSNRIT